MRTGGTAIHRHGSENEEYHDMPRPGWVLGEAEFLRWSKSSKYGVTSNAE
jgi:hypothetical protein